MPAIPPIPPPLFSGFNWNDFKGVLTYVYDSSSGPSGSYRALTPSDFGGGGGSGATAANQASQITIENAILGRLNTGVIITGGNINAYVTGKALPVTNLPSGTSGSNVPFVFNQDNNALLVQIPNLDRTVDSVTYYPSVASAITGQQGARTGIGTIFSANARNRAFLQNVGTTPIAVALSGAASSTNFSLILKGGTIALDGNGGTWETTSFYGSVSVSGSGISYVAWEM